MKNILITGGSGFLSKNLSVYLNRVVHLTYNKTKTNFKEHKYHKINLENKSLVKALIEKINPDIIINTAGLTNVEICEKKKKEAIKKNYNIVKNIVQQCINKKIKLIHISTDHLFDGLSSYKYSEKSKTKPLNFYAKTKLKGERYIQSKLSNYIIIRSNFFGWDNYNSSKFFTWIFDNINNNKKVSLYNDVFFTPVSTYELSKIIKVLIKKNFKGTINVSSNEKISKYQFGKIICEIFNFDKNNLVKAYLGFKQRSIIRPLNMSLNNLILTKKLKYRIPSIHKQILELKKHLCDGLFDNIRKIIPYGKHFVDRKDINSVINLIKNQSLTQGKTIDEFESQVSDYVGSKYAVAVSSCSAGMHLACKAFGLSKKDEIITSPISFVSTANAGLHCGAKVRFSDIDNRSLNINNENISLVRTSKTKLILPVHFGGNSKNMQEIYKNRKNELIIEDAAHSFGGSYDNKNKVGSCKFSDLTVFSLHPVKTITTAEGGIITTNNKTIYEKLICLRSHGITKNRKNFIKHNAGPWYYEVQDLSNHYRITDLQCSLGLSQLEKVDRFVKKRVELASNYFEGFANCKNFTIGQEFNKYSSYHLFILRINFNKIGKTRAQVMRFLRSRGIGSQVHYIPIPMHPLYENLGFTTRNIPNSLKYYDEALSIPIYYDLTFKEQKKIIKIIKEILEQ